MMRKTNGTIKRNALTKKSGGMRNESYMLPENEATFHGLHDWHKRLFEKNG